MSSRSIAVEERIDEYIHQLSLREPAVLGELRRETAKLPNARMQISPEHGQFMGLLIRAMGAKRALEVGTFTGYSSISVALALPADGRLICCDVSKEWTDIARRFWKKAGVEQKIELRLAPARDSLDGLLKEGGAGTFDFAFIDADKNGYDAYYERTLQLLRPGGLVAIDNIFQRGKVADPAVKGESVDAVRALNAKIHRDERVVISMLPIGDGVTLALKK